jgi:hypothetical protein
MGRKKVEPSKKKKRLDVYIESNKVDIINENSLMPQIKTAINKITKPYERNS